MADPASDSSSALPANLVNGALALLTLLGGLYYFNSRPLASDRPVAQPVASTEFVGEQRVEARLWEDPFKDVVSARGSGGQPGRSFTDSTQSSTNRSRHINDLIASIVNRMASTNSAVVLLPVMLQDGQYSEDSESRIRGRFAVVSGLGVRGLVPEDPEHIGRVFIPWPLETELEHAEQTYSEKAKDSPHDSSPGSNTSDKTESNPTIVTNTVTNSFTVGFSEAKITASNILTTTLAIPNTAAKITNASLVPASLLRELSNPAKQGTHLELRFEWFIPRDFYPDSALDKRQTNVLVLWLSESFFDDDPLVRIPLLLYRLRPTNAATVTNFAGVKLIGPALSRTLEKMLPGQFPNLNGYAGEKPVQSPELTELRSRIDIYCATPSAMDEVLVSNVMADGNNYIPRQAIRSNLVNAGFNSFHNFTATDAQLAEEACAELKLRDVDLSDKRNHLVLISEWDTFYSRMVSLTYQAKLAVLQGCGRPATLQEYVKDYRLGIYPDPPKNFHRFYYMRGLDGQTVEGDSPSPAKTSPADGSKAHPASTDDFRQWEPDANKAEGQSQLDYLGRLGDHLQEMDDELKHTNAGQIKVIGVVGSDVYDTLIILQALRARFPDVLFFTTDLDARFWHPKELKWSRNLIVFSGYGLALDPVLQHGTAPFRDSDETALYAATMAALGDTNLNHLAWVPARRFEIGRHGVVDLSVTKSFVNSNDLVSPGFPSFQLHPATFYETYQNKAYRPYKIRRLFWSMAILVIAILAPAVFWKPLRRATWKWSKQLCESLEYTAEDFGGPDGAAMILRQLYKERDPIYRWILAELKEEFKRISQVAFLGRLKEAEDEKPGSREQSLKLEEMHKDLANAMAAAFNRILKHKPLAPPENHQIQDTKVVPGDIHNGANFLMPRSEWENSAPWGKWLKYRNRLRFYEPSRKCLDYLLEKLSPKGDDAAEALHLHFTGMSHVKPADQEAARVASAKKLKNAAFDAAEAAREAAVDIVELRKRRRIFFLWVLFAAALAGLGLAASMWWDTFHTPKGQALSFENGASAWPAQICRLSAVVAAICSCVAIYYRKRIAFAKTTRDFRFTLEAPGQVPEGRICAIKSWLAYTKKRGWQDRWRDIFLPFIIYFLFCCFIFQWSGGVLPFSPIRDHLVERWNSWLLNIAVFSFLILTFVTIDTASRCRKFILKLGAAPTDYPEATRRHFARINGDLDESYLDEWIDIQLIAELTEQIGGMVYYPFFVFGLMLIARNESWAQWSWPPWLLVIFGFNLVLAAASTLILQFAADRAKRQAVANLKAKVKRLQNIAASSKAESNATQAEKLLDEISSIRRGAFAHAWQSPLLGAILVPSSGLTIVQAVIWALSR